jgi:peroxiredoxin
LRKRGFRIFAASVDPVETNRQFAESLGLTYPVLSDPTKETARAYGVLAPSGYASRWTFYIGADGRILDIDKKVSASSHGADVLERVQGSAFRVQRSGSDSRPGSGSVPKAPRAREPEREPEREP